MLPASACQAHCIIQKPFASSLPTQVPLVPPPTLGFQCPTASIYCKLQGTDISHRAIIPSPRVCKQCGLTLFRRATPTSNLILNFDLNCTSVLQSISVTLSRFQRLSAIIFNHLQPFSLTVNCFDSIKIWKVGKTTLQEPITCKNYSAQKHLGTGRPNCGRPSCAR